MREQPGKLEAQIFGWRVTSFKLSIWFASRLFVCVSCLVLFVSRQIYNLISKHKKGKKNLQIGRGEEEEEERKVSLWFAFDINFTSQIIKTLLIMVILLFRYRTFGSLCDFLRNWRQVCRKIFFPKFGIFFFFCAKRPPDFYFCIRETQFDSRQFLFTINF